MIGQKSMFYQCKTWQKRVLLFFVTKPLYHKANEEALAVYYTVIKHSRNGENTRLRLVFTTFPSCSQMPVVSYHSLIRGKGFSIC